MQTAKSGAKYPLVNGRHEFDNGGYVEVTNENHVKFTVNSASYVNISNILNNTASNSVNNIKCPLWFTLNNNDICILKIFNFSKHGIANVSCIFAVSDSSSDSGISSGILSGDIEKEYNITSQKDIGCLYCFCYGSMTVEFDVEFTVNGERWI